MIGRMLTLAAGGDKPKMVKAFRLAERITPDSHKGSVRFLCERLEADHPVLLMSRHIATELSAECRDRFIECLVVNTLLRGLAKRRELSEAAGVWVPTTILVSPTMRCNLACAGCYAGEYSPSQDLDGELLQRIVDEANGMGVYLFTLLGGEPFLYRDLLGFARANRDSFFQIFTNGTLLTDEVIGELAEVGNVALMLSVDGTPELTDQRRGPGVHRQVMSVMDRLGEAGVLFGYSATVTRGNWQVLISDEFVDPLVAKGAMIAWHFLYMPVGRDPDVGMMPTPGEREQFRLGIHRLRATKPFFPIDFWGDAPWVGGCIAGKHYMHINSEGWVEPCIFTHFATDNIRDMSLLEAFNSRFFCEIRSRQPFSENLLMPCMWIDNPQCSRDIMACTGARPTHDGADSMLVDLQSEMNAYSLEAGRVFDPIWSCLSDTKSSEARADAELFAEVERPTAEVEPNAEAERLVAEAETFTERAAEPLVGAGA
jgi:MoaA/NifB/PqqE/SkfB family radical SAM enzyme